MSALEIQNYQPADQPAVVEFLAAMLSDLGFAFEADGKDADLGDVAGGYQAGGGMFLVARDDGQLVGTVALRPIADGVLELRRFYVHPAWQGQGIGTNLLEPALAHAKSGRWRRVCLDTTGRSSAALRLFRRHGFVEIERVQRQSPCEDFHGVKARFRFRPPGWQRWRRHLKDQGRVPLRYAERWTSKPPGG